MSHETAGAASRRSIRGRIVRLLAIADDPADDEGLELRKHVGVLAGYLTILAPFGVPFQGGATPATLSLAFGLAGFALANLLVLARHRDFEAYVTRLLVSGVVFVPAATVVGGGVTGATQGIGWAFLIPAYAILALGERRAIRWYGVFLAVVAVIILLDPFARAAVPAPPYLAQLSGILIGTVVPLSIVFLLLIYTDTRRVAAEARVDELLTNAIPATIAHRLRRGERRIAEAYEATTIVFADIVGFTPWAQRTPPDRVVALLDDLFTRFDGLADRDGLEKIKTVGDAYMAVAGAPIARSDHAVAAVRFGLAMIDAVRGLRAETGIDLEVRVGVASGPAVGGVIGRRRLLFDLWGDTVNLASRMESSGVPGRVQIAASTAALVDGRFGVERREVDVKGLGLLTAYLVR